MCKKAFNNDNNFTVTFPVTPGEPFIKHENFKLQQTQIMKYKSKH